jgi:hypothetical protein
MNDPGYPTIHYTELPPSRPGSALTVEWELYRREVGRLLADGHEGRHILIKGEEIIGIYETRDQATDVGYMRFPGQPFLAHQIQTRERLYLVRGHHRVKTQSKGRDGESRPSPSGGTNRRCDGTGLPVHSAHGGGVMNDPGYPTVHYTELPPSRPGEVDVEWETYRREAGRLLAEGHEGRYVLIKGEDILGIYETRNQALDVGYARFPGQGFFVHQIQTRERVYRTRWC